MTSNRTCVTAVAALMAAALLASGTQTDGAQAPRPLALAAASDLQAVMPELIARYRRDTGGMAQASFGSSGTFFAQIQNGAPFDVFLSADIDYPRRLIASGHADKDSLYAYATGHLVLWARKDSGVDVAKGLPVLREGRVKRVAIANPRFAPYGRAAVAALKHEGLYDAVQGKIVMGDNISQTAQLVESGNADAGIISLSLAVGPALRAAGSYAEISATTYPPIEQAAVIVNASTNKPGARQFLNYVKRPDTGRLLRQFGFAVPASPAR